MNERRSIRELIVAMPLMLLLGIAPVAVAQSFDGGKAAYDRGDFATAMTNWRALALQGDIDSQVRLGDMYYMGKGVPKDVVHAYMWLDIADLESVLDGKGAPINRVDRVTKTMTAAQIKQAQEMARHCLFSVFEHCD